MWSLSAPTLDDLLRGVFERIITDGVPVTSSRGSNKEISAACLHIENPRARLSRTETRGRPFSCLGELCWYLAGSDRESFIAYYVPKHYKGVGKDKTVPSAYGPRLWDWRGFSQIQNILDLLNRKVSTRQAVIQLFDASDLSPAIEPPCTCCLQFLAREGRIDLIVYMRSNDAYIGLPHDVFCFTMIQELVARSIKVEVGTYTHIAGSLHLYEIDEKGAQRYLKEGLQSTQGMAPMPHGNPWPAVRQLLQAEERIRNKGDLELDELLNMSPYWADLHRLLVAYRCKKNKDSITIAQLRQQMHSDLFHPFLDKIAHRS